MSRFDQTASALRAGVGAPEWLALPLDVRLRIVRTVTDLLAAEREAGAAEVRARVERLEPTWPRGMYGCPDDMFSRRDLNRALTTEDPS